MTNIVSNTNRMRLFHVSNCLLVRKVLLNQCPQETLQPTDNFEPAPDKIRLVPALWTCL